MIKFLGENNDLLSEDDIITKTGFYVLAVALLLGFCLFLIGKHFYGEAVKKSILSKHSV